MPFLSLPSPAMLPYPCALRLSHGLPLLRTLPSFLALPFLLTIRLLPVFPALWALPERLPLRDFGPGLSLPGKRPPSGSCGAKDCIQELPCEGEEDQKQGTLCGAWSHRSGIQVPAAVPEPQRADRCEERAGEGGEEVAAVQGSGLFAILYAIFSPVPRLPLFSLSFFSSSTPFPLQD